MFPLRSVFLELNSSWMLKSDKPYSGQQQQQHCSMLIACSLHMMWWDLTSLWSFPTWTCSGIIMRETSDKPHLRDILWNGCQSFRTVRLSKFQFQNCQSHPKYRKSIHSQRYAEPKKALLLNVIGVLSKIRELKKYTK